MARAVQAAQACYPRAEPGAGDDYASLGGMSSGFKCSPEPDGLSSQPRKGELRRHSWGRQGPSPQHVPGLCTWTEAHGQPPDLCILPPGGHSSWRLSYVGPGLPPPSRGRPRFPQLAVLPQPSPAPSPLLPHPPAVAGRMQLLLEEAQAPSHIKVSGCS